MSTLKNLALGLAVLSCLAGYGLSVQGWLTLAEGWERDLLSAAVLLAVWLFRWPETSRDNLRVTQSLGGANDPLLARIKAEGQRLWWEGRTAELLAAMRETFMQGHLTGDAAELRCSHLAKSARLAPQQAREALLNEGPLGKRKFTQLIRTLQKLGNTR
jgi:hypothetical protein